MLRTIGQNTSETLTKTLILVVSARDGDLTVDEELNRLLARAERKLRSGAGRVRIDMTGVRIANTKLVAGLVLLKRVARRRGAALEIVPSVEVRTWLALCGLQRLLCERQAVG